MAFDDPAFQSLLNFINMFGGSKEVTTQHKVTPLSRTYHGPGLGPDLTGPGMAGFEGDPNAVGGLTEGPNAVSLGWTSQATADKIANLVFDLMSLPIPFASVIKNATQKGTKTQDLLTTLFNPEAKAQQPSKPSFLQQFLSAITGQDAMSDISTQMGEAMKGLDVAMFGPQQGLDLDVSVLGQSEADALGLGAFGEGPGGGGGGGSLGGAPGAGSSGAPGADGGFGFGFGM